MENSEHFVNAVDWYVKLTSENVSPSDHRAWADWMNHSKQNEAAWEEIKRTLSKFQSISSDVGMSVLSRHENKVDLKRRSALKHLALFAAAALPGGLLLKDSLMSNFYYDYSTKVGERRQVMLADGTILVLNTNSAVTVNLTLLERTIKLHQGEMLITTGHANGFATPLLIETPDGSIVPMGTRFNVRKFDAFTRVSLFEGKIKVTPKFNDNNFYMSANEVVDMYTFDAVPGAVDSRLTDAWLNGYIEVNNLPLQTFIDELTRYHRGILVCHPNVQNINISGSYSIDDIDTSLSSLSQTFPIKIQHATRLLTIVMPTS